MEDQWEGELLLGRGTEPDAKVAESSRQEVMRQLGSADRSGGWREGTQCSETTRRSFNNVSSMSRALAGNT
jgi:hypothetical protein